MDWLTGPQIWIALATLTFLEIVLGVDNIIFVSILSGKLPAAQQPRARRLRLLGPPGTRPAPAARPRRARRRALPAALVARVLLRFSPAWVSRLTQPWFNVPGPDLSGRDLI